MQKKSFEDSEYLPAEDTFFLEDYLAREKGEHALDIGSGSGYLTKSLTKSFSFVVGTDINFYALRNQTYKTPNLVCCSGADALRMEFDLVICNLPYLATDEIIDVATDGGYDGVQIPIQIIRSGKKCLKSKGKFLYVTTTLSDYKELMRLTEEEGFSVKILAKKKMFYEELLIIEAIRN